MRLICLVVLSVTVATAIHAQEDIRPKLKVADSTMVQIITTTGGSSLIGRITEIGESSIRMLTDIGSLDIDIAKIANYREIEGAQAVGSKYWFPNPNSTRLFLMPTARPLERGKAYFQNVYVFFNGGAVGVTDQLAIGGGLSLFPGAEEQVWYLAPKLSLKVSPNVDVGGGVTWVGVTSQSETAGFAYGVTTIGNRDASLTIGGGYGFSGQDLSKKPIFVIGGEKRLSRVTSLVTENWIVVKEDAVVSFGIRFFADNMTCDLAFFRPLKADMEGFPFIPYVDFLIFFN